MDAAKSKIYEYHLHSSMERLKEGEAARVPYHPHGFTFQYGEIKSDIVIVRTSPDSSFTFQYGEIKSCFALSTMPTNFINLHSSMERLKGCFTMQAQLSIFYLHSSMERLKAVLMDFSDYFAPIYIPVWRD